MSSSSDANTKGNSQGEPKPKPASRPMTSTGFEEPWFRERPTSSRLYRFLDLETAYNILTWRPKKLPGPKTSAAILLASALLGGYTYDRLEAKKLKQAYIDQVSYLSEQTIDPFETFHNRIDVYAARLPEDPEPDRPTIFFKTYVKPFLNAAGYDYNFVQGQIPGSVARILLAQFKLRRLEKEAAIPPPKEDQEIGIALVGRNSLKEYLWALKKGWLDPIDLERELQIANGDLEEIESQELAAVLDRDGLFRNATHDVSASASEDDASAQTPTSFVPTPRPQSSAPWAGALSPFLQKEPEKQLPLSTSDASHNGQMLPEAPFLPLQPPVVLVPFSHPLGSVRYWPKKLFDWMFGERQRVQQGADAAMAIIAGQTELVEPPKPVSIHRLSDKWLYDEEKANDMQWVDPSTGKMAVSAGDPIWRSEASGSKHLDFDLDAERWITKSYKKAPQSLARSRKHFYDELPKQLQTARDIESGEREMTKAERADPPPTEEALHAERTRKEKTWRREEQGFRIVRPGSGMTWDDRFRDGLRFYVAGASLPPRPEQEQETERLE